MIYLACPYSHDDRNVRTKRFRLANAAAGEMMANGLRVFSPISHSHPIAEQTGLHVSWEYWEQYDREMLAICESICVLTIDGWKESTGVQGGLKIARGQGIPWLQTSDGRSIEQLRPVDFQPVPREQFIPSIDCL